MTTEEIRKGAEPTVEFIRSSEIYKQYMYEKEKMSHFPELKKKIDEYRIRNYHLQMEEDADTLFEKADDFRREYEAFRDNPMVNEFLQSELAMCRLMQDLCLTLTEQIDFDMTFEDQ